MKRRTFILAAAATAVVATVPIVYFSRRNRKSYHPLVMPEILGQFCDEAEIRLIGDRYRSRVKGEDDKDKLTELLLTDNTGKKVDSSDKSAVAELLNKKVLEEFRAYKTIVEKGWIITITEARQCALFSLTT